MSDQQARIENLSPAKRKLLELMSARETKQFKMYPLSYTQQRLWFIDQLDPGKSFYNIPFAVRLRGALNRAALAWSFQEIVRRHEILRTRFPQRNGVAVQEVVPQAELIVAEEDLRSVPAAERESQARNRAQEEAVTPFNLLTGPLLRVTLLQIDDRDHLCLVTMHHIVGDGWSTAILEREFFALYGARCQGLPSPLPELEIQYGDYALWQRGWLNSGTLEKQLQYWKTRLAGVESLDLLTDYPRPPVLSHRGAIVPVRLAEDLSEKIKDLAAKEGCTVFMVLLAGLQLMLSRANGQDDIAVGTSIASRQRMETENLIGCFINMLVLRSDVNRALTFRQFLSSVREVTLEAYDHQDLPFDKLVEELQPVPDLGRTPLFQVLFVMQNVPEGNLRFPGLDISVMPLSLESAKVELTLAISEERGKLLGSLEYDVALFERSRVERMVLEFQRMLRAMVSAPDQRIDEVCLLSDEEKYQVVVEWNRTAAVFPQRFLLHELFESQSQSTPEAIAITYDSRSLTFAELNYRSNQVAHYLKKLGIGPDVTVGICVERSLEMVVGLLGILKAGGAYVPLDPGYPQERLNFMVADAGITLLLTHTPADGALAHTNLQTVWLDRDWPEMASESGERLAVSLWPQNLAYVMYTSGSTGRAKGVAVSHRSVCNQLWWAQRAFVVSDRDRFLQKASFAFDASVIEIFLPLISGARIVAAKAGGEQDVDYLVELVAQAEITCIDLPPSLLEALVHHPGAAAWTTPRLLMSGGEALKPDLVKSCHQKSAAKLWNTYGPTETTVQSAVANELEGEEIIPIGKPVDNTQLYVLDSAMHPQPVSMVGELYIGGEGLARGYWARPDLTAERFVPNPFDPQGGARLYRTGDLVRWRPDGRLEFVGRADQQVKLRGYRIEPGEIEALIQQHAGVTDALVIVHKDKANNNQRLIAYVCIQDAARPLQVGDLRKHLREKLPAYMVPGAFIVLDKLPRLPNGKINRQGLPSPQAASLEDAYVAPRNVAEEILCGVLEEVLNQKRVGIHDSFFELGGHSLLATQLVSRIRKAFSLELPLRIIFEAPTPAALAAYLAQETTQGAMQQAPPIERTSRDVPLPLSFAQMRLWFIDRLRPGSPLYNMPMAVQFNGPLDKPAMQKALSEIARRHESVRTSFPEKDGVPMQQISESFALPLEMLDLRDIPADRRKEEVDLRIQAEAEVAFDLLEGPLLRAKLLQTGDEEHVLLVTMHHIISDGWSVNVLEREFALLYEAFSTGNPSPLKDLPIQYADYAVWQRQWLQGEVLETQFQYWQSKLQGIQPLEFPTDHPRPPILSHRGKTIQFRLTEEFTQELKRMSRREGVTTFMTLLAAFQVVLARYSGQEDIAVGIPIAGRRWLETEDLIGFFVNTLVLRTDLGGFPTFRELLARVRKNTLEAYDHQDIPFERLVDELQPERDLSRTPFFQAMFAMGNFQQRENRELPGLQARQLAPVLSVAKCELDLGITESPSGIVGEISYAAELYDSGTIERLIDHIRVALEAMVQASEQTIHDVALLTSAERRQLLEEWNRGNIAVVESQACLHMLFEEQAARTPIAVALTCGSERLTYRELNARANQLAHYLLGLGAGPEARIALCLERSLDMVVAILGVLKSGAAYVPIDPKYPEDRISYVLRDSQVTAFIAKGVLGPRPQPGENVTRIDLENDQHKLDAESTENVLVRVNPLNAAYVIYTSGSTGQPKGVIVTHANVTRLLSATDAWFKFNDQDCWTLFHSYAFDFSVWELWGALLFGGRLVVVPYEISRSPQPFHDLLCQERVTVLNQTPSAFWQLMQADAFVPQGKLNLRVVIFGGEALDLRGLKPWFEKHGERHPQLINMYGITETTVHVTYRKLHAGDAASDASLIGWRIPDLQLYIVDRYMNPLPVGAVGELVVGGLGLARGYHNQPALTAQRFVPNPFSSVPGSRLYRSGDMARYLPNGDIEYRGRADQQVKIRGFRIELGEIEAALESHSGVEKAVVVARTSASGNKRLVGYFIASPSPVDVEALRHHLRQRLPDYMVPAALIALDQLPLTQNGKLDVKALPDVDQQRPSVGVYVAPRTAREELLAAVWSQVLEVDEPSVEANFFDLGGDSILSVRILALARKRGLEFSLTQVFTHPTVAALARVATLAGESSAVPLAGPLEMVADEDRARLPQGIEDAYPLTQMQAGMLFQNELAQEQPLYWNFTSFHLRGPWNAQAMEKALARLIARHPILRTSFALNGYSEPLQLVHGQAPTPLWVDDLRHLSDLDQKQALAEWESNQKQQKFELTQPPLFRVHVHLRSDDSFQVTVIEHHAILDGWSLATLQTELFNEYIAEVHGQPAAQAEQEQGNVFRQFVALERQALASAASREYWDKSLGGMERHRLPSNPDHKPGGVIGHSRKLVIPEELADGIRKVARQAGVSLKSVFLSAHLRVLSVITGQSDVVAGLVTHGRPEVETADRALGLFLNSLPLRLQLTPTSWINLVQDAFRAECDAIPHRHYPLAKIMRDQGGEALFETLFNYVNFHVYNQIDQPQELEVLATSEFGETEFAWNTICSVQGSEIALEVFLKDGHFSSTQADAVVGYYTKVLELMVANPGQEHGAVSLLSTAERTQILDTWNRTHQDYPARCVHEQFEAQAEQMAEAVAVELGDHKLSYGSLNSRANQLAHRLREIGVGPEVCVGICLERSLEMVISILAVLKAGGAYVPLDPGYPAARLQYMVEDSRMPVMIVQNGVPSWMEGKAFPSLLNLDSEAPRLKELPYRNPSRAAAPGNICYVIYTSGSTGAPKGAAVLHAGLSNHMCWIARTFSFTSSDVFLQKTSFSFDASVWEFFAPLMSGGTLVMARPGGHQDSGYLVETIRKKKVTVLQMVPSMLEWLVQEKHFGQCTSLRLICSGGEVLAEKLVRQASERLTADIVNLYGPTEATIDATYWWRRPGEEKPVSLGRPVANARVYVLDQALHPAPLGVAGELYIAGPCLARGYWGKPGLTAERFVPDPFSKDASERMYKTGDLVRWQADGSLVFLGRVDHQIKIRGHRIELGEIEGALLAHPQVKQAVAVLRQEDVQTPQLVAYVVRGGATASLESDDLKAHCRERLPEYMVPALIIQLEQLPLNSNGKVDRQQLPRLELEKAQVVAARDLTELELVRIWQEVLNTSPLGIRNGFFESGGHSLLALRLVSVIAERMQRRVSLAALLENPTVEQMAALVRSGGQQAVSSSPLVEIQRGGLRPPLFLVHGAGGNALTFTALAGHLDKDQPVYAFHDQDAAGEQAGAQTVEQMASEYLKAIKKLQPAGPYQLAGWSMGGLIAFEMARQLQTEKQEVGMLTLIDSFLPEGKRKQKENLKHVLQAFLLTLGFSEEQIRQTGKPNERLESRMESALRVGLEAGLLPAGVDLPVVWRIFEAYRRHIRAAQMYQPQSSNLHLQLMRAADDLGSSQNGESLKGRLQRLFRGRSLDDASDGWKLLAAQVQVSQVPGSHFTLLREPNVPFVAERLKAWLAAPVHHAVEGQTLEG